ncbi:hypothetical protein GOV09_02555 [Candidatus Woesearchaeota archaeon]|nr:hypothetical protein [Candidatus Woesearchaeota archaeon]
MKNSIIMYLVLLSACQNVEIPRETGSPIEIYFCPEDNCGQILSQNLQEAKKSIHCAFFDLDLEEIINILERKSKEIEVKLVIDSDNAIRTKVPIVMDDKKQLSHNKFCIIDHKRVITGSFNPTENGNTKNNNNLIIIPSRYLADNYESEFSELWQRRFGEGKKVAYPKVIYNGIELKNFFCPEDGCAGKVSEELRKAEHSIYFMLFTLTDENIADAMLMSNATIKGMMEKLHAGSRYSQFTRLKEFGLDVKRDENKGMMHHKVFIIDNRTVITGSYNPTNAGDKKNDENVLIIHSPRLARRYLEEFNSFLPRDQLLESLQKS